MCIRDRDALSRGASAMCAPKCTAEIQEQVVAVSGDYTTLVTTPWMLNFGPTSTGFRMFSEFEQLSGGFRGKLGWRPADVTPDFPGTWTWSDTIRTAAGPYVEDFTTDPDPMWVQGGLAVSA